MTRTSERERLLLVVAAIVVVAIGHFWVRLDPLMKEAATRKERVLRLERDLEGRKKNPVEAELASLRARRDAALPAIERDRSEVARLVERAFPRDTQIALAQVSELGRASSLVIRESAPHRPAGSTSADDLSSRPRRKLVVVASFGALRAFVEGLATLPAGPVQLERLSIARQPSEGDSEHELLATLVIVL